jgi:cytochrome c-type biogenesis protein CcmH/NrfF
MLELWLVPLVNWIWIGFAVVALGTIIALMPETVFAFATTRVAAQAATTALLLVSVALLPVTTYAQGRATAKGEQQELRAKLEGRIMCTCGCRRPLNDCGMLNCGGHAAQTAKMEKLLAEGKTEKEIIAIFVRDAGSQDVLAAPLDEGFNRLAWFVPYAVGLIALVGILMTARRWTRPVHAMAGDAGRLDPALDARLDDELRNLD